MGAPSTVVGAAGAGAGTAGSGGSASEARPPFRPVGPAVSTAHSSTSTGHGIDGTAASATRTDGRATTPQKGGAGGDGAGLITSAPSSSRPVYLPYAKDVSRVKSSGCSSCRAQITCTRMSMHRCLQRIRIRTATVFASPLTPIPSVQLPPQLCRFNKHNMQCPPHMADPLPGGAAYQMRQLQQQGEKGGTISSGAAAVAAAASAGSSSASGGGGGGGGPSDRPAWRLIGSPPTHARASPSVAQRPANMLSMIQCHSSASSMQCDG